MADAGAGAKICTMASFADIHASWLASAAKNERKNITRRSFLTRDVVV
jgi:hypothetical protein